MTTIGQNIRKLRKDRGWTQEDIAEKLGISAQAVSKWESEVSQS
ncbi:MAG: helix-turn-helix transcriptional regulator [Clostridia bacterium]|nr:helix-turn-helix transcriptional regulator [Clostridia bacterium]